MCFTVLFLTKGQEFLGHCLKQGELTLPSTPCTHSFTEVDFRLKCSLSSCHSSVHATEPLVERAPQDCKIILLRAQILLARRKSHRNVAFPQHCAMSICLWLLVTNLHNQFVSTGQCPLRQVAGRSAHFHNIFLQYPVCLYLLFDSSLCVTNTMLISQPLCNMPGMSYPSELTTHPILTIPIICEALRNNKELWFWLVSVLHFIFVFLLSTSQRACERVL